MANTRVYFLVDQSSSMWRETKAIRDILHNMTKANDPGESGIMYHFIVFSDDAECGPDISKIPVMCGSTNIFCAFQKLHSLVTLAIPQPEKVIVVFISDGADNFPDKCNAKLKDLGKLSIPSVLFTIGVNSNFPTGFVVDLLRPLYHQGSPGLNPVIPVQSLEDLDWAFAQLEGLIATRGETTGIPTEISDDSSAKDISIYVKAIYNASAVVCAQSGRSPKENYESLFECKARVSGACDILMKQVAVEKSDARRPKPLASTLLTAKLNTASKSLSTARDLLAKLNKLISETQKGILISDLSDSAKQELIGYSNRAGKFIVTASKYKGADFNTTKESLMRLLRNYTPSMADGELTDPINLCSQAEYFSDAAKVHKELIPHLHTLAGVLGLVSFIGRTITWKTPKPTDALQINPWLCEVAALPLIHPLMTTFDFFETFSGKFQAREEEVTGLMILSGHATSPGIFTHIQSYLVTENVSLYHPDARLATAGSVLLYILSTRDKVDDWVDDEFHRIETVCKWAGMNNTHWQEYLRGISGNDTYRSCLVSQSADLNPSFTCPGLTKYVLALWHLIYTDKCQFTLGELIDRFHALVFEFIGRCNSQRLVSGGLMLTDCFTCSFNTTPIEFLTTVPNTMALIKEATTVNDAQREFVKLMDYYWPFVNVEDIVPELTPDTSKARGMKYYQFSIDVIEKSFRLLARMSGYSDISDFTLSQEHIVEFINRAASVHSSITRSKMEFTGEIMPMSVYALSARNKVMGIFKRATNDMVPAFVKEVFTVRAAQQHKDCARVIPKEHMERFAKEFKKDIKKDWCVNDQGLSMIACCSPLCDHYLERLSLPDRCDFSERETCSDALVRHLNCTGGFIHGFHKCVALNVDNFVSEIVEKIEAGTCLNNPQREFAVTFPDNFTPEQVSTFRNYADYKRKHLGNMWGDMLKNVRENIAKSALEHKLGKSEFMEKAVGELKAEFHRTTWSYKHFRDTFMAKYGIETPEFDSDSEEGKKRNNRLHRKYGPDYRKYASDQDGYSDEDSE